MARKFNVPYASEQVEIKVYDPYPISEREWPPCIFTVGPSFVYPSGSRAVPFNASGNLREIILSGGCSSLGEFNSRYSILLIDSEDKVWSMFTPIKIEFIGGSMKFESPRFIATKTISFVGFAVFNRIDNVIEAYYPFDSDITTLGSECDVRRATKYKGEVFTVDVLAN